MQPDADIAPTDTGSLGGTTMLGAVARWTTAYYDEHGVRHTCRDKVPVDEFGRVVGAQFRCRRCKIGEWFPVSMAQRGNPACGTCSHQMDRKEPRRPQLLPWGALWRSAD